MKKDNYFLSKVQVAHRDQSKVLQGIETTSIVKCRIRDNFSNELIVDWLELTPVNNTIEIPVAIISQLIPTQYEVEIYNNSFNTKVVLDVKE